MSFVLKIRSNSESEDEEERNYCRYPDQLRDQTTYALECPLLPATSQPHHDFQYFIEDSTQSIQCRECPLPAGVC